MVTFTGSGWLRQDAHGNSETVSQLEGSSPASTRSGTAHPRPSMMDPDLVAQAVRIAVGAKESPTISNTELVRGYCVGTAHAVPLVVDNCEHVLAPVTELLRAVLVACPNLHVLATSREPLGIAGEVRWRIPSLALPDAVALFVEVGARGHTRLHPRRCQGDEGRGKSATGFDGIPLRHRTCGVAARSAVGRADRGRARRSLSPARARASTDTALLLSVEWSHDFARRRCSAPPPSAGLPHSPETVPRLSTAAVAVIDDVDGVSRVAETPRPVFFSCSTTPRLVPDTGCSRHCVSTLSEKLVAATETDTAAERHLAYYAGWAEQRSNAKFSTSGKNSASCSAPWSSANSTTSVLRVSGPSRTRRKVSTVCDSLLRFVEWVWVHVAAAVRGAGLDQGLPRRQHPRRCAPPEGIRCVERSARILQ